MDVLHLTPAVYRQIRTHGEQTYPHECCGVLLGRSTPEGWRVQAAIPAGNTRTDSAHNRYQISPLELVKIERDARRQGLDIAGFYHSHPDHPAQWSQTDFAEAHWLGCAYVITQVVQGKAALTNSFLLAGASEEDKRFELQTILVDEQRGIEPLNLTQGRQPMTIFIPTPLRTYTAGQPAVEVDAATVAQALQALTQTHPDLHKHLFTPEGKVRAFVNLYLNDEDIRYLPAKEATAVTAADTLSIIPSIAGGH